jgi:drug/metabolite transporter superfamily protein YnfA
MMTWTPPSSSRILKVGEVAGCADVRPDRWDIIGAFLCIVAGTVVIILGPRHA